MIPRLGDDIANIGLDLMNLLIVDETKEHELEIYMYIGERTDNDIVGRFLLNGTLFNRDHIANIPPS
jgi:hypothetical protein